MHKKHDFMERRAKNTVYIIFMKEMKSSIYYTADEKEKSISLALYKENLVYTNLKGYYLKT